jgi:hypothetical protein
MTALTVLPGDTAPMPDRFRRDPRRDDDDQAQLPALTADSTLIERNAVKLDRIKDDVGDMRVAYTSLAGDVRAMLQRIERHDGDHAQASAESSITGQDIERRLRTLERRSYAIPSLAALLALAGFGLDLWTAIAGGHI